MNKLQPLKTTARELANSGPDKYDKARTAVAKFVEASHAKFDGYAYSTGYLGSALVQMASTHLTKAQFSEFLAALEQATPKQTA